MTSYADKLQRPKGETTPEKYLPSYYSESANTERFLADPDDDLGQAYVDTQVNQCVDKVSKIIQSFSKDRLFFGKVINKLVVG